MQFKICHPILRLRKPEPCSLSLATAFNETNVNEFYNNLEVLTKFPTLCKGVYIYNLDETALITMQAPQKILSGNETRHLNKVVSAERGILVSGTCIISANGMYLPPIFVFPE